MPVVLEFNVDRVVLAGLSHLVFLRPLPEYYDFVAYNRRQLSMAPPPFGVIYGPVSKWPKLDVHFTYDQVSFHTPAAVATLGQALSGDPTNLRIVKFE